MKILHSAVSSLDSFSFDPAPSLPSNKLKICWKNDAARIENERYLDHLAGNEALSSLLRRHQSSGAWGLSSYTV